jgi:hypothetical protein
MTVAASLCRGVAARFHPPIDSAEFLKRFPRCWRFALCSQHHAPMSSGKSDAAVFRVSTNRAQGNSIIVRRQATIKQKRSRQNQVREGKSSDWIDCRWFACFAGIGSRRAAQQRRTPKHRVIPVIRGEVILARERRRSFQSADRRATGPITAGVSIDRS